MLRRNWFGMRWRWRWVVASPVLACSIIVTGGLSMPVMPPKLLAEHGMACSMSGKGECLDNAVAERFFGSLKRERTSQRYYVTRQEARDEVVDYIEMF